jgi:hypothetical protein
MPRTRDERGGGEPERRRGPTGARLDAAIEGGRDPTNINTADRDDMKRETAVCRLISTSRASDIVRV